MKTEITEITPTPTPIRNTFHDALCNMLNISEDSSEDDIISASIEFKEKFYEGKNTGDEGIGTDKQSDSVVK